MRANAGFESFTKKCSAPHLEVHAPMLGARCCNLLGLSGKVVALPPGLTIERRNRDGPPAGFVR